MRSKVSTAKKYRQEEDKPVDPTADERARKTKDLEAELGRLRDASARNQVRACRGRVRRLACAGHACACCLVGEPFAQLLQRTHSVASGGEGVAHHVGQALGQRLAPREDRLAPGPRRRRQLHEILRRELGAHRR